MSFHDHSQDRKSARQILVEAEGTPFAPPEVTKPLVYLLDGRVTNDDLSSEDWIDGIEATDGMVALYFGLAADHERWLAYDGYDWHRWTTYPSGGWDHRECDRWVIKENIEQMYCHDDLRRSKVVRVDEAREFVWGTVEDASYEKHEEATA